MNVFDMKLQKKCDRMHSYWFNNVNCCVFQVIWSNYFVVTQLSKGMIELIFTWINMILTCHFNSLKLSINLTNDYHWHSNVDHIPSADHWWRKKSSVQKINDPSDWITMGWKENTIFTHKCLKTLDKTHTKYHNNFDKFFDWWDKKITVLFHILDGWKNCILTTPNRGEKKMIVNSETHHLLIVF